MTGLAHSLFKGFLHGALCLLRVRVTYCSRTAAVTAAALPRGRTCPANLRKCKNYDQLLRSLGDVDDKGLLCVLHPERKSSGSQPDPDSDLVQSDALRARLWAGLRRMQWCHWSEGDLRIKGLCEGASAQGAYDLVLACGQQQFQLLFYAF